MKWAAGIQTSPRAGLDLPRTLGRLASGGWAEVLTFGEPGTILSEPSKGIVWPYRAGDWAGWFSALAFLHATQSAADYYVMFEDDITICRNVRQYVEQWIGDCDAGAISLYTPPPHHRPFGRKPIVTNEASHGWRLWGAQAVIFSRASLRGFLGAPAVLGFRDTEIGLSNAHKDAVIGIWGEALAFGIYYHSPSLVQHMNLPSLTGSQSHVAGEFLGEDFDPASWGRMPLVCDYTAHAISLL